MSQPAEIIGVLLYTLLTAGAVIVFVLLQLMLTDPRRPDINKAWFEQFESNMLARYSDRKLNWRVNIFSELFRRA